jgi:hypothetical protein
MITGNSSGTANSSKVKTRQWAQISPAPQYTRIDVIPWARSCAIVGSGAPGGQ